MRWKGIQRLLASALATMPLLAAVLTQRVEASEGLSIRWGTIKWQGTEASAQTNRGSRVSLGLDRELTSDLKHLLARAKPLAGAGVLVDARTGQVLAATELGESDGSLLFDPVAPAASVFKVVTTAALYEKTSVTPTTRVCTEGGLRRIERSHLSPASGPDAICGPFAHALGVSRNAAYAQLATTELMRNDLIGVASSFGFGNHLALDVRGRVGALDVPYNDLEFARTAAGFRGSKLSVFGGAQLALTIASGGLLRPMHFATTAESGSENRVLSQRTARRLQKAMEVTIHSGTARESFVKDNGRGRLGPIQVAGKTGTLKPAQGAPTASWFIGFAPSDDPMVVISVLLQNPERWHQKGHQLARDVLQSYFARRGVKGLSVVR